MLDSLLPVDKLKDDGNDTDPDSPMDDSEYVPPENPYLIQQDPEEADLESRERHKYLLAKSFFDTREYDRCAAVFLPPSMSAIPLAQQPSSNQKAKGPVTPHKGSNARVSFGSTGSGTFHTNPFPRLSQKSLFLTLYAKYLAGEKRKDEETEMVLGPADGGMTVNKEIPALAQGLQAYFTERTDLGFEDQGQGWLEYLYGVVLAKSKNEKDAKRWLLKAIHLFPFHWGAWQELNDLLGSADEVGTALASYMGAC